MTTRRLEGWLFDVDELGSEVILWVYDDQGRLHRLTQEFEPVVYVGSDPSILSRLGCELETRGLAAKWQRRKKREFWTAEWIEVLELTVADPSLLPKLRSLAAARDTQFTVYNIDIPTAQYYLYKRGLFPTCKLEARVGDGDNGGGRVREIRAVDSAYEMQACSPPMGKLRVMRMRGELILPLSPKSHLLLECGDEDIRIRLNDERKAIREVNDFIERHDPDVILSHRGDSLLFPALFRMANRSKRKLFADRDEVFTKRTVITEGRTFFSYGRVLYKGPAYPLRGRWHIDVNNSFFHNETGLDGILELARLAKIPVQRMARQSPGTAMSSMELDYAVNHEILIPWRKSEPEAFKTALELLTVDKGGLTFQPKVGAFENIAEIDFASMYPALMVKHNVSPETVLCSCCENRAVPEANYNICERRRGLISTVLEPLVKRRRIYQQQLKECADETVRKNLENRRSAIKWMLVSCFGYLGYKNARFGRIEAHEAVTAFGREKLLRAKEMVEEAGFRLLHALTDSLWIAKDGVTRDELLALCEAITKETDVEMNLEGTYRWIVFLPSKESPQRPVATRYYGLFDTGEMKIRGLACRRRDTPFFIREAQRAMLEILKGAASAADRARLRPAIDELVRERIRLLKSGNVQPGELAVRRTLTKAVESYAANTRTSQAAAQYREAGIPIHPGETVSYIVSDERTKAKREKAVALVDGAKITPSPEAYIKMLTEAVSELGLEVKQER